MPSNRRVKEFAIVIGLIVITILFMTNSGRQVDKTFYHRTVAAMEAKKAKAADSANIVRKIEDTTTKAGTTTTTAITAAAVEIETSTIAVAAGKQPPQIALGEGADTQRRVGQKWDTGAEDVEEKKVAEQSDEEKEVDNTLNQILKRSPIIIFSKSYCPFSKKAKWIFNKYDIIPAPFIVELDTHALGPQLQDALKKITGRRTVPNILVSGTSIGGGDDVAALHESGELEAKIKELAGKRVMQVKLRDEKET